ncbi:MAG: hypothetical protein ACKESB_02855 [Candidatus Hodgkinia cicadicola]
MRYVSWACSETIFEALWLEVWGFAEGWAGTEGAKGGIRLSAGCLMWSDHSAKLELCKPLIVEHLIGLIVSQWVGACISLVGVKRVRFTSELEAWKLIKLRGMRSKQIENKTCRKLLSALSWWWNRLVV